MATISHNSTWAKERLYVRASIAGIVCRTMRGDAQNADVESDLVSLWRLLGGGDKVSEAWKAEVLKYVAAQIERPVHRSEYIPIKVGSLVCTKALAYARRRFKKAL